MSIAFERNSQNSIHGMPSYLRAFRGGDRRFPPPERRGDEEDDSSGSSSIGRNSDASDNDNSGDDFEESEVQSSFKGPLDTMDALEEVLPIKRGISKFYSGKSKSFTSLADASSAASIKDFAKPENPFTRKRKNLLVRRNLWDDKNRACPSKDNESCISKRPAISNQGNSCLPPLHPRAKTSLGDGSCSPPPQRNSHWRSFSLSDLQSAAAAANSND